MTPAGVFDGWDWNTHPALFGYAATIVALMWVVWRLVILVENLTFGRRKGSDAPAEPVDPPTDPEP